MIHLHRGGTSLLLRLDDDRLPAVLHWGPDLGALSEDDLAGTSAALATPYFDSPISSQDAVALLPQHATGWLGRPGLVGSRDGASWSPMFARVDHAVEPTCDGGWLVRSTACDEIAQLEVSTEVELTIDGLVRVRAGVQNLAPGRYRVERVEPALPVPDRAGELLDMTGRHGHERHPSRRPFDHGSWNRESWGGRPGHDSATTLCAGVPGFGFRSGTVWASTWRGAATSCSAPSGRPPAGVCCGVRSCCSPTSWARRPARATGPLGGWILGRGPGRAVRPVPPAPARATGTLARRGRSSSTPGKPSTSTTTSTGSRARRTGGLGRRGEVRA